MNIPNRNPAVERLERLRFENSDFGNMITKIRGISSLFTENIQNPHYETSQPKIASFKNNLEDIMESAMKKLQTQFMDSQEEGVSDGQTTAELRIFFVDNLGGEYMQQLVRAESAEIELPESGIKPEEFLNFMIQKCEVLFDAKIYQKIKDRYIQLTSRYTSIQGFDPIETLYTALKDVGNYLFLSQIDENDIESNTYR
jgi:hypothetical protein